MQVRPGNGFFCLRRRALPPAVICHAKPTPEPATTVATGGMKGTKPSVVVVGGGIGGLVTAGRLAKEGLDVTLLEAGEQVSGTDISVQIAMVP